jgi:hypothetical protein
MRPDIIFKIAFCIYFVYIKSYFIINKIIFNKEHMKKGYGKISRSALQSQIGLFFSVSVIQLYGGKIGDDDQHRPEFIDHPIR